MCLLPTVSSFQVENPIGSSSALRPGVTVEERFRSLDGFRLGCWRDREHSTLLDNVILR